MWHVLSEVKLQTNCCYTLNNTLVKLQFADLGIDHDNKFAYHTETNRNGYLLDHFIIENGLKSLNNKFQKKSGKLWTHTHPNVFKSQL